MAKQITFSFNGVDYTLEYTARSVQQMDREGFVASDIEDHPMTVLPALFAGAFKAHHKWTKQEEIDKIYAAMPDKEDLIGKLATMYNDPINNLLADPDEKNAVSWKASF